MNTTNIGNQAEVAVCEYLQAQGYKIMARNWKTKYCEIDIVAAQKKVIWFVEVKYRQTDSHGSGLEYITWL